MAFPSPAAFDKIVHTHITKFTNFLSGVATYGERMLITQYEDSTNYATHLGNVDTTNGRALQVQYGPAASPTVIAQFAKAMSSIAKLADKGGQVHNVKAYGATGDGSTDDSSYFAAAIAAAEADQGIVLVPYSATPYRLASRLTVQGHGVKIVGTGMATSPTNGPWLKIDHTSWPAIVFGNSASVTPSYVGMSNITLVANQTPSGTATFEGDASFAGMIAVDRCGSVLFDRVRVNDSNTTIACGTANNPLGATRLEIINCEAAFRTTGIDVRGVGYLVVDGGKWQPFADQTGTVIDIRGVLSSSNQDGIFVRNMLVEDPAYFLRLRPTQNNIANVLVQGNIIDRCLTAAIQTDPSAGASMTRLDIIGNRINGWPSAASTAILIDQDGTGLVRRVNIIGNSIEEVGGHGIQIATPAAAGRVRDVQILGNSLTDIGVFANNTYSGILVNNDNAHFTIAGNAISSAGATNDMAYGINVGTGCTSFRVGNNDIRDAATAPLLMGTAGNNTTQRYEGNSGDARAAKPTPAITCYKDTPGNSYGPTDMARVGATSETRLTTLLACRLVGITANTTAALASGGTATVQATVAGSTVGLTLTCTGNGSAAAFSTHDAVGIAVSAGTTIGLKLSTNGSFGVNNITADLWVVYDH